MKLIDLLVQELPKRGGWPKGSEFCVYEHIDKNVSFTKHGAPKFKDDFIGWTILEDNDSYWILGEGFEWREVPVDFNKSIIIKPEYEAALAESKQVEWSGSGLPPVGTECEWLASGDHDWMKVKVLAYHEDEVWLQPLNGAQSFTGGNPDYFRPMLTEAERKREEARGVIAELCRSSASNGHSADLIYDAIAAGKIPGIKLAD